MELALTTDGALATLRIVGVVRMNDTAMLADYLRVARENGAVRCVLDLADCPELPTTIVSLLMREAARFAEAGGALALSGVETQNPFLTDAVVSARFLHYRTLEEACATERVRAVASTPDAPREPAP
ncbi:MAG TPA: hypothetical protein VKF32_10255 [Thermoanaerobaculia bacterium]|nr:hypothetical protein [Thermoanaerobaculia bacterium]